MPCDQEHLNVSSSYFHDTLFHNTGQPAQATHLASITVSKLWA